MKTKLKYICLSAAAGLTLSLSSCSDFMDLTPEDQYDEATARSNGASNTKGSIVPIWFWQISTTFLKKPV